MSRPNIEGRGDGMLLCAMARAAKLMAACGVLSLVSAASAFAQPRPLPPIPNLAGKVLTVNGPVDPASLGQTLMHEHIFIDYKRLVDDTPVFETAEAAALYEQPLTLATLHAARYGQGLRARKFIGDFEVSRFEVMEFKKRGGGTIVDVSGIGLGRDPHALRQLSQVTGLHIVMGAAWYARDYYPPNMDELTIEAMTDIIVRDVVAGVNGTDIRSGIIGEIGVDGHPLIPNEIKNTRASARASRLTGAPMSFHSGGYREEKLRVLDIVASEGVAMSSVVMGHSNSIADDLPLLKRLLERGVFIEFDYLGLYPPPGSAMSDRGEGSELQAIVKLIDAGYADQIVLGHDICAKQQLKTYGGTGYAYISDYFLPELKKLGVSDADIYKIMVENPRRALTFVSPRSLYGAQATAGTDVIRK